MDFTVNIYKQLLDVLSQGGYTFQTFTEFLENPAARVIILRHDVDAKKMNSLRFAGIQHERGIKGTYFFRMVPQSYDAEVIRKIAEMGHEIGYHYEDMDMAGKRQRAKGGERSTFETGRSENNKDRPIDEDVLIDTAIGIFEENLKKLRELYPVKTICMHGSPRSKWDNKALWKKYNYRDYGIIGEPYFDIDFNEVFYLTDTGRRWDGDKVSIRDRVHRSKSTPQPATRNFQSLKHRRRRPATPAFHSTGQIINAAASGSLPDRIMFTFHPQRWNDKVGPWLWEYFFQNLKNQVKRVIVASRKG